MSPIDECPIRRNLFYPVGLATDAQADPDAALRRSIRPGPPPSRAARLRQRMATFLHEALWPHGGRRGYPTAQHALSSVAFGLVIGLVTGIAVRPIIAELAAPSRGETPRTLARTALAICPLP